MEITVDKTGDVAVVVVPVDKIDATNAGEFERRMAPVLQDTNKQVLNLSCVRFVDSSGLGAMLFCLRQLVGDHGSRGGDLKLSGMTEQVRVAFELVCMHQIFDIFGTKEEAVHAFEH